MDFWKKPTFILSLVLGAFFLKGVFLAALFPIFAGQDETKHFNSIEFLSEPRPINWPIRHDYKSNIKGIQGSNYTEEIKETAKTIDFDNVIKGELYNTSTFEKGFIGKNEAEIKKKKWNQYNEDYPINRAETSLYHKMASHLEKLFEKESILFRYFFIRIFSVFLGTLTVLVSYLIMKNIGLSQKISLLSTAIIAFQPRFSIYTAAINYDTLLILIFTLFTLGGVLALKHGLNWKNFSLLVASAFLGMLTKPTALLLLGILIFLSAYFVHKKIQKQSKKIAYIFYLLSFITVLLLFTIILNYVEKNILGNIFVSQNLTSSILKYLSESLTIGKITLSSRTYWGALSWVNSYFLDNTLSIIWIIETFSAVGIATYFFAKKQLNFLPEKKFILFLLLMIAALQFEIRAADWRIGGELGTPGRYFLPNIAAHMILVFTGIGALLRRKEWFEKSLIIGLILMMTLSMYIIFDVIIYRYYL